MNDSSRMLREMADRLLGDHCTLQVQIRSAHGEWPGTLWARLEEAGLPQIAVPEELGGAGASLGEAMAVARSVGRHAVPLPLVETILANALLARVKQTPLAGAASVCTGVESAPLRLAASSSGEWALSGCAAEVPWGSQVDHLVLVAHTPDGAEAVLAG